MDGARDPVQISVPTDSPINLLRVMQDPRVRAVVVVVEAQGGGFRLAVFVTVTVTVTVTVSHSHSRPLARPPNGPFSACRRRRLCMF